MMNHFSLQNLNYQKFKAIVFDLDDTLYPEIEFVKSGFKAVACWIESEFNINRNSVYEEMWNLYKSGVRGRIFDYWLDSKGFDMNVLGELIRIYREHKPKIKPYPEVKSVLNFLKCFYKLGIITDGYVKTQQNKIDVLGIKNFFSCIIISDEFGVEYRKPNSLPYEKISEFMGIPNNECVYVGDNPSKDFYSAKKLGWFTIHVNRKNGVYKDIVVDENFNAHIKISSLKELIGILNL